MVTVIGIDPGSSASGVAWYEHGQLTALEYVTLWEWPQLFSRCPPNAVFIMEDVKANSFLYGRNAQSNRAKELKVAGNVGQVKEIQTQIENCMKAYGIKPMLVKPVKGNWGTMKAAEGTHRLRHFTGWTGSSNKDTRSAAFLAYPYRHMKVPS